MTPEQRQLRAKIAANARWSQPMARADQAEAARAAILARLERQVDPDRTLPTGQRSALVQAAARRLSAELNAAKARKRGKARLSAFRGPHCWPFRAVGGGMPAPGSTRVPGHPGRRQPGQQSHGQGHCRAKPTHQTILAIALRSASEPRTPAARRLRRDTRRNMFHLGKVTIS